MSPGREIAGREIAGELRAARTVATDLQRARRELVRVHRLELARLLREGARLALGRSGAEPSSWRASVKEALACARADRLALEPASEELLQAGLRGAWMPGAALDLVAASLRLDDCREGRRLRILVDGGVPER